MATDVATGLRDALMGKGCQPDERTSEQKVRDFRNAACEEAPDLVLPLLCCLRETDEESLRRQLTALRPRLLQVANSLSSFVPGWKENLVYARQTLQEQISEDYRISWGGSGFTTLQHVRHSEMRSGDCTMKSVDCASFRTES